MLGSLMKAFSASQSILNYPGYWSDLAVEFRKLTGWNLDHIARASANQRQLKRFCRVAMDQGTSARACAASIFENGYTHPNALDTAKSAPDADRAMDGPVSSGARNPKLAAIFHQLKDEVLGAPGCAAAEESYLFFRDLIVGGYHKYHDSIANRTLTPDQGFRNIVSDEVQCLLSCELKSESNHHQRQRGTEVALVVLLRVLFGSGPGYADAVRADADMTALSILDGISRAYHGRPPDGPAAEFADGANTVLAEFVRRCLKAYATPIWHSVEAQNAERQLTAQMSQAGVDFMALNPTVCRALVDEVLVFENSRRTVEMFLEVIETIGKKAAVKEEKERMLLEFWQTRGEILARMSSIGTGRPH